MSDQTHSSLGELLYEYTPMVTQVVEYGASFEAIASRQSPPPAEGARVDVYFEGPVTGARLSGSVKGVDYLKLRADGRFELDIYAEITAEDGKKIALAAEGVALGKAPVLQLRENVKLTSSHPEHAWVNQIQIWASGTVAGTIGCSATDQDTVSSIRCTLAFGKSETFTNRSEL